jgi:starch synthase
MEIIHLSAECYPIAKVGGLGDVVGALPKYQNKLGHVAKVVMPAYQTKFLRENVYGYGDDTERFLAFQIAVLDWMAQWEHKPDVIHCHDHHTGLIPFMTAYCNQFRKLSSVPTVLTIHNGQYQGQFGWDKLHYIPPFDLWKAGQLEWKGAINPLAAAIKCAWRVTTVSPSYLEEIRYNANGLEGLLWQEQGKSAGILNGIDNEVWDPSTDTMLYKPYSIKIVEAGKKANKEALCSVFNLDPEKPLFTFIGRLVGEKGADLLPDIFYSALLQSNGGMNVLVLGSGDPQVEGRLNHLKEAFPGNYNAYIGYNEQLSHQIYAGADFLLMPSRVEPCGLNQMYALRYGTIPIVRRIGGLKDTVTDIGDNGFGICHDQTSVWDVGHAIDRALELYADTKKVKEIRKFMMQLDHSWDKAAQQYINLYQI